VLADDGIAGHGGLEFVHIQNASRHNGVGVDEPGLADGRFQSHGGGLRCGTRDTPAQVDWRFPQAQHRAPGT
jgi:hypothetical protein